MAQDTTLTQEEVTKFAIRGGLSLADAYTFWRFYEVASVGATGGIGGGGALNKVAKFSGATSIANSQMSDDGTHITMPDLSFAETDLGALGAGPLDLDLSAYDTVVYKFSCPAGGTKIRSIKRKDSAAGQILILKNLTSITQAGEGVCILMQDDPAGVHNHIHLAGRQPWYVLPSLGQIMLSMDATQQKWWALDGLDHASGKKPLPITATIANSTLENLNPPDDATGLLGQYADWWRLIPGASTVINTIASPVPAGSAYSRRLLLTNYGANTLPLAHNTGTGAAKIFCPAGATFNIRTLGSVWLVYDGANNIWMVEAP